MRAFNQIILLGNIAADPEFSTTKNGKSRITFPLAVTRNWSQKIGDDIREVDYHKIVAWGKLAEICRDYVAKGTKLLVSGNLLNHCYDDSENNRKYMTEIHASQIEILSWKEVKEDSAKAEKVKKAVKA